ncbi:RNA polymerase sigma factor [Rudanella paleaurantiibacter]|uniref:RNA polymerase sigma factor n=1 Tax=Rudanella paleaurantiibacter TaxID=2614655 RepID=UPI001FEB11E0|nr:RNA polymerase sigma factor [Rudanella paleaurantiibacter]
MNASQSIPPFEELYTRFAPRILKLCLGYTGEYAQAQDLMQETFIKAWQHLPAFRGNAEVSTWLYRIAVNTCLNHLRTAKRQVAEPLLEQHMATLADDTGEPDEAVRRLYGCVSQLPETDRLIISLVLDDVPYSEIAQIVGVSEGNLRVKIHRIKQQLVTLFHQHGPL